MRIAIRDIAQNEQNQPESQVYHWGIKNNTSLDGGSRDLKVASSSVSSDVPSGSIPTETGIVNTQEANRAKIADFAATMDKAGSMALQELYDGEISPKDYAEAFVKRSRELEQGQTGETKYSSGMRLYWKPKLNRQEWDLLNYTLKNEIDTTDQYLDDATKWLYKTQKGTTVFSIYGIGNGTEATPLYASGGETAKIDYEYFEAGTLAACFPCGLIRGGFPDPPDRGTYVSFGSVPAIVGMVEATEKETQR